MLDDGNDDKKLFALFLITVSHEILHRKRLKYSDKESILSTTPEKDIFKST